MDTPDATTVVFNLPAPKPGLLAHFATHFAQGFQPKHFLGQFHPDIDPNADANAQAAGFDTGYEVISGLLRQFGLDRYAVADCLATPTRSLACRLT